MDDEFRQLVSDCKVVIAITGNPAEGRFELKELTGSLEDLVKREDFIGLTGLAGLTPRVALAVELDEAATKALSQSFVRLLESAIERAEYWLANDFKNPPLNRTEEN